MKPKKYCVWIRDRETGETILQAIDVDGPQLRDLESQYRGSVFECAHPDMVNDFLF